MSIAVAVILLLSWFRECLCPLQTGRATPLKVSNRQAVPWLAGVLPSQILALTVHGVVTPAIPALKRLKLEHCKFKSSLGYIMRSNLNKLEG